MQSWMLISSGSDLTVSGGPVKVSEFSADSTVGRPLQMVSKFLQLAHDLSHGNLEVRDSLGLVVLHLVDLLTLSFDDIPQRILLVVREVDDRDCFFGVLNRHMSLALGQILTHGLIGYGHLLGLLHELLDKVQKFAVFVFLTALELVGEPGLHSSGRSAPPSRRFDPSLPLRT